MTPHEGEYATPQVVHDVGHVRVAKETYNPFLSEIPQKVHVILLTDPTSPHKRDFN